MASSVGGNGEISNGSDPVSDKLLSHVSHFVIGPVRKQFATGPLGLRDEQYDNIEEENSKAQRRNYEVLRLWRNRSRNERVKTFIEKLVSWQQGGYVSADVWEKIGNEVDPRLLPPEVPPEVKWDATAVVLKTSLLNHEALNEIRTHLKESLRRRCRNYLSHDWLPKDKAKSFPLKKYYVELDWTRKLKKALRDEQIPMNRIHDIFLLNIQSNCVTVLIRGEPGVGKSCSLAMLCFDWVEGDITGTGLDKFEFVFLIELRYVNSNIPLEDVIMKQHARLDAMNVSKEQVRAILEKSKTLLLLDGYDEYKKGTNDDIDNAITNTLGNCFVIVTCRPGEYMEKEVCDQLDGEIQIKGLSEENIERCSTNYLDSQAKSKRLVEKSKDSGIYELLRIPIVLLMVCVLFHTTETLPRNKTEIVWEIIRMYIKRAVQKSHEKKGLPLPEVLRRVSIHNLLLLPVILITSFLLYIYGEELSQTQSVIVFSVLFVTWNYNRFPFDRVTLKRLGTSADGEENLEETLFILGELSWEALQRDTKQLLISKMEVEKICREILTLGLLHGTLYDDEATLEEQPEWLTYPHKMFQDFLSGYHNAKLIQRSKSKGTIQGIFKSWNLISRQLEAVKFTCGLIEDPTLVIDHICQEFAKNMKKDIRQGSVHLHPTILPLVEIAKEMRSKKLRIDPLRNIHIHYVQQPPLRQQSELFAFGPKLFLPNEDENDNNDDSNEEDDDEREGERSNSLEEDTHQLRTCAMIIDEPHMHGGDILEEVSALRQSITDLFINKIKVKQGDLDMSQLRRPVFKMDPDAESITVESTSMPLPILQDLGSSITSCRKIRSLKLTDIASFVSVAEVGSLTNIRYLNLGCTRSSLSCDQCSILCQQLQFLRHLEELLLTGNPVGPQGAQHLADSIQSWGVDHQLKKLYLWDCGIDTQGCARLLQALSFSQIRRIDISRNEIDGAFQAVGSNLVYPKLAQLDIAFVSLRSEDIRALSISIRKRKIPNLNLIQMTVDKLTQQPDDVLEAIKVIVNIIPGVNIWDEGQLLFVYDIKEKVEAEIKRRSKIATSFSLLENLKNNSTD